MTELHYTEIKVKFTVKLYYTRDTKIEDTIKSRYKENNSRRRKKLCLYAAKIKTKTTD